MPAPEHIRSRRRGLGRDTRRSAASRGCDASLAPGCRSARVDGSTAPHLVHSVARAAVKRSVAGTTGAPLPPPVIEAAPAPTNDLVDAAIDGLGAYQEAQRRALTNCAASGGFAAFLLEYLSLPFNNNSHANTLSLSFYQCRGPSTRLLVARRGRLVVVRCEVGGDARRYGHGEPGSGGSVLACVRLSWQDSSSSLARSARICARVSRAEVGGEPISCSREAVRPPGCVASPGREGAPCNTATFRSRGLDVFAPPP